MRARRSARSSGWAVVLGLALTLPPAAAEAAAPKPRARFVTHHHAVAGDGWHLELTVSARPDRVAQLVLYSERCRSTVLATNIAIGADGTIDATGPFRSGRRRGTWLMQAFFTDPQHLEGSFRITAGRCDGGARVVSVHADGHPSGSHAGAGHAAHHAHLYGTPPGRYPTLSQATPARRAEALQLWRATQRQARGRYATYARARARGFVARPLSPRRPRLFHLRHSGYAATPTSFDAKRPESIVYWQPKVGVPFPIAFMYRLLDGRRPRFASPLLGWHRHGPRRPGATQMTHVWLTGDLRSAMANCMPVTELEAAIPSFRFDPAGRSSSPESIPCPVKPEV